MIEKHNRKMRSHRLWRRDRSCHHLDSVLYHYDEYNIVIRWRLWARDVYFNKIEACRCGEQLQVSFSCSSFTVTGTCFTVAYRLIDVIRNAQREEFLWNCVIHASLTGMCISIRIMLHTENTLSQWNRLHFLLIDVDLWCSDYEPVVIFLKFWFS